LKAGGTGLNLTAAQNVIHYDLWWNPAVEAQATDRAYRIGQRKNVMVYRLITKSTFEERINEMIQNKKELANLTVGVGENWVGNLSNKELRDIFSLAV
jgi:SNF2 family DNA or RNA helicase